MVRVLLIGPTSAPWETIAEAVEADLARLARPGVELSYRCTGAGPAAVHSDADAEEAAPFVVRTIVAAAGEGFDGFIVDCTADPGVGLAGDLVTAPVIGPGEAMREAIARAPQPVCVLTGDELRSLDVDEVLTRAAGAATLALGGTGFSHLVDRVVGADPQLVVLDPLAVALDECLRRLGRC